MATKEREIETYDTSSFLQKNKSKVAMGQLVVLPIERNT